MPLDLEVVGRRGGPALVSWTSADAQIYALGIGAGLSDPLADLEFTTECGPHGKQAVIPTFAIGVMQQHGPEIDLGDISASDRLHAEQSLTLFAPLPPEGSVHVTRSVTDISDKGSGALVTIQSTAVETETNEVIAVSVSRSFIRGEGGFGGATRPDKRNTTPQTAPGIVIETTTSPNQALLFRQAGDRNPLHVDPDVARRGGFPKPILHGLCTYGVAARILLRHLCDNDPSRFRQITGRFTAPVFPGDTLTVAIWQRSDGAAFQVRGPGGVVVIDRGELRTC